MNDDKKIVIKRQFTQHQYFRFLVSYSYSKWYVQVVILAAVIFAVFTASTGNTILPWAVLVLLFLVFYSPFYALYTVKSKKNRRMFLPVTYTFSSHEITGKMALGKDTVKWEIFRNWRRIGGCYALIISANSLIAIPEVDIPYEDEERFIALLREKIPARR